MQKAFVADSGADSKVPQEFYSKSRDNSGEQTKNYTERITYLKIQSFRFSMKLEVSSLLSLGRAQFSESEVGICMAAGSHA